MVHFLRTLDTNITIIETEVYNKEQEGRAPWVDESGEYTEVSSSIDIAAYSMFLLGVVGKGQSPMNIINHFAFIDGLREWLWESYYSSGKNNGEDKKDIEDQIGKFYVDTAEKLGLRYVTD